MCCSHKTGTCTCTNQVHVHVLCLASLVVYHMQVSNKQQDNCDSLDQLQSKMKVLVSKYMYMYMYIHVCTCTCAHSTCLLIHDFKTSMRCLERKARQRNTTERQSNTTQHNSPKAVIFQRKRLPWVGLRTHDCPLARRRSYQLSYRDSSAESHIIKSNQSITTK